MRITVINLKRRPDRMADISHHLTSLGLDFSRLDAIDGRDFPDYETNPVIASERACWQSHALALSLHSASDEEFNLILEDDAMFVCPKIRGGGGIWKSPYKEWAEPLEVAQLLRLATSKMERFGLDVLQIGHVTSVYDLTTRQGIGYLISEYFAGIRPRIWTQDGLRTWLWRHQFRAGTHAYIVKRKAAHILKDANASFDFAADDFMGYIARNGSTPGAKKLTIGCLSRPIAIQRYRSADSLDTDIS